MAGNVLHIAEGGNFGAENLNLKQMYNRSENVHLATELPLLEICCYVPFFFTNLNQMDRLESIEMTALECAALLDAETHAYRPKQNYLNAIRYDGSLRMAIAIEECCPYSYIEWDEGENFCGLMSFTEWGIDNSKSQFVHEGDYLVKVGKRYILICQDDFEKDYERVL